MFGVKMARFRVLLRCMWHKGKFSQFISAEDADDDIPMNNGEDAESSDNNEA